MAESALPPKGGRDEATATSSGDDLADDALFERRKHDLMEKIENKKRVAIRLKRQIRLRELQKEEEELCRENRQHADQLQTLSPHGYVE